MLFLIRFLVILFIASPLLIHAQKRNCYVWVTDHWERPRANKTYHPDSLHCFENGVRPDGQPTTGGVTVVDHRITNQNIDFQPAPVLKLVPKHIKGDREFDGNGPLVNATVSIRISDDQKHIIARFYCKFSETVSDWTTGVIDQTFSIYEAPGGAKIMKINSAQKSTASYTDGNHSIDRPAVKDGTLVSRFEMNGDTDGNDIGNDTNDDSYLNVYFNSLSLTLADQRANAGNFPATGYQLASKQTGMLLDVQGGLQTERNTIWQYQSNLTASQRFEIIPQSDAFLIKANISDLYFTVKKPEMTMSAVSSTSGSASNSSFQFSQNKLFAASRDREVIANTVSIKNQLWNIVPTSDKATYYLESKAFPGYVLQSPNSQSGQLLMLAPKANIDIQKWIIQRPKRINEEANYGYGQLYIDAPGFSSTIATYVAGIIKGGELNDAEVKGDNINVNILAPAHRSVGEMRPYSLPTKSYERLEGIVLDDECQVAVVDFPTCHYTHDFTYRVKPDINYEHLLATSLGEPNFQKDIEIEWETGLGSDRDESNPAVAKNNIGNSFGFFSEGHQRNDVIWNWPSPGDSVYIEGMWIWERGHGKPHTEIHPPHFVATKRHLPVSFNLIGNTAVINNKPSDQFYGHRTDVFGSADGSTAWNTKALKPFAQIVDMKRQDYIFTITTNFARPAANAQLKWLIVNQKGNTFVNPFISLLPDGKSVQVNYQWKTRNIANTAKIAQTILLYWDVPSSKGIASSQKPTHFIVTLEKIQFLDNGDFGSDGDITMYANTGDKWFMLNEFTTTKPDILNSGIGDAKVWEVPPTANTQGVRKYYPINAPAMEYYLLPGHRFRIFAKGWERDHMNTQMGKVLNEYSRRKNEISPFLGNIFSTGGIINGQIEDDRMDDALQYITVNSPSANLDSIKSKDNKYILYYSITRTGD